MTPSTSARIKCALVFILFMVFSIGPIPVASSIGLYVSLFRPRWFKTLVDTLYADLDDRNL